MSTNERRYVRLNALERLAAQIMYITTPKTSEERIAQCFNVVRLTVRNSTIGQGLRRGSLESQIGRLRHLYEQDAGSAGSESDWQGVLSRAREIALARFNELAARDARRAA